MTGRRCLTCGGPIAARASNPEEHSDFCSIHCEHYYGLAQASARHEAGAHVDPQ